VTNNHIYGSKVPQTPHFGGLNRYFKPNMRKIEIAICSCRSVYQIDMKFDRQLWPATETSWVVSYDGKTSPRWRTAAILKIVISPYLSEKSSDFDEIVYTAAYFVLDERHVIKNENVALDRLRVRCFPIQIILSLTIQTAVLLVDVPDARLPYLPRDF